MRLARCEEIESEAQGSLNDVELNNRVKKVASMEEEEKTRVLKMITFQERLILLYSGGCSKLIASYIFVISMAVATPMLPHVFLNPYL